MTRSKTAGKKKQPHNGQPPASTMEQEPAAPSVDPRTLEPPEPSPSQSSLTLPADSPVSTSAAPPDPRSASPATSATPNGQETISLPAESIRAMAFELAQMREELNQLKMTGHVVQGMAPAVANGGPKSRLDMLIEAAGKIAEGVGRAIPRQNSDDQLRQRLVDSAIALNEGITQVVLKNSGIALPPPVKHMTVVQ